MAEWKEIEGGKFLLFFERCEDEVFIRRFEEVKTRTPANPMLDSIERAYYEEGLGLRLVDFNYVNQQLKRIGLPILDFPSTESTPYTRTRGALKAEARRGIRDSSNDSTFQLAQREAMMLPRAASTRSKKLDDGNGTNEPVARDKASLILLVESVADVRARHATERGDMEQRHARELAAAVEREKAELRRQIAAKMESAPPEVLAEIARQLGGAEDHG